MPFVRVDYMKGQYTKEQLCSISKAIQSVLIEQFDVPSKEYFQIYQNMKILNFIKSFPAFYLAHVG
jgi:hypothetical protein